MAETYVMRTQSLEDYYASDEHREKVTLIDALKTRPLTVSELQRVAREGHRLLVWPMQPYNKADVVADFAALLSIQHLIQLAASREG